MKQESINILLNAVFEFLGALVINLVLYILLFYALFKTITSLEDEKEVQKWMKYWIFYGLFSFICSYLEHGTLVKTIACGVLLIKFNNNIILHTSYDLVLSKLLDYSFGYVMVIISDIAYGIYRFFEFVHWTILTTCNITDEDATQSVHLYEDIRTLIKKRTKQTWQDASSELFKRISRNISRKDEHTEPIEHANSADHDEIYRRLSRTCIVEPTRIDDDDNPLDPSIGIRKRH